MAGEVVDSEALGHSSAPGDDPGVAPIGGFWRRVVAFAIDSILLGILGQALVWTFPSVWFEIGPYGRFVGAAIGLCYFGAMNSTLARGSTFGKRLMRLSVRGADGQPVGITRSLLRTSIWLVPATLNGWALPILRNPAVSRGAALLVFGVGGAVLVTMLFNRRTRQGLHDLVTRTYVLRVGAPTVAALPSSGRLPWVLAGTMLVLAVALVSAGSKFMIRVLPQLQDVMTLQQQLQSDERFFTASVSDNSFHGSDGTETRTLAVQVWRKGTFKEAERVRVMNDVARVALSTGDREKFDLMRIEILSAYDLGIASGSVNHADGQPVSVWKQRIERERSEPKGRPQ